MNKKQVLESLKKAKWIMVIIGQYCPRCNSAFPTNKFVNVGNKYVSFGLDEWPRISYDSLTIELWKELTGLKA